ncbi:MAG: glycosyltransferase family 2 protein [Acidobacteria bacterium]|nr:MAG: glycosyltransferase family 2 protein [Acidobacteriota bacterium]REK01822.1 MAG: glycosyltransferase family 2 protein [Acidobacteriota bacterium]REK14778.1 MAG: glycosyltransferase family 2 protein [Acidobacteriota bacterium]REK45493.1 MAG: glycosyltransferase family 2 protein [Acidobacteriota bacterium]
MNRTLSIIVPAYNEQRRLGASLAKISEYVSASQPGAEVIVVDDGSSDGTADVARDAFAEYPDVDSKVIRYDENRGKGFAVRTGFEAAKGHVALFSDADLSTPISETPKLVDPIFNDTYDVTLGSRALDRSLIGVHQPWRREQGGKVFNLLVRTLTGLPFWDTQCGFKAFNMVKFRPLLEKMTIDRFGFDVEFLYAAYHNELRLKEIPVRWDHCEGTKVSIFRDSTRMVGEVREIRKRGRIGSYSVE